jgi:uncharacterized membrane protein
MKHLRTYLMTGLLVWVPLVITLFILKLLVDFMDQTLLLLPVNFRPEAVLGFRIPGLGAVLAAAVLLLTGLLVANIVGRKLVDFWESVLKRIPLVRSVYSAAKSFAEVVLTSNTQSFKEVLLIEYPRKGIYSLGFQTASADAFGEIRMRTGEEVICVFVPTTPNPTSGFIMFVPKQDVIVLEMAIEEAVKMVVSLGVVVPQWPKSGLSAADRLQPPAPAVAKD